MTLHTRYCAIVLATFLTPAVVLAGAELNQVVGLAAAASMFLALAISAARLRCPSCQHSVLWRRVGRRKWVGFWSPGLPKRCRECGAFLGKQKREGGVSE